MDVAATYGPSGKSGIAMLRHPTTSGFPQTWILRAKGSMQNAVYRGQHPVALAKGKPVTLRYRLVLHRGELAPARIKQLQAEYAKESF